jgi:hypothetical protein
VTTKKLGTLQAVYDDDLEALLKVLDLYPDYAGGRLQCAFCGDTITPHNLYAVFPDSGQVKVSCDKPECVQRLIEKQEAKP